MRNLPNSDKYRKSETPQVSVGGSDIDRANAAVPLIQMLWALGCQIPAEVEKSWKFRCPFSSEHGDGGVAKNARYYPDTNSAFCFDGHDGLTPVKLTAWADGLTFDEAALRILQEKGLDRRYLTYQERFQELREHKAEETPFDTSYAVQALRDWLSRQEGYSSRQYDVDVREALVYSITVLNELKTYNPETVRKWLETAKKVMTKALERGNSDEQH
jgi:hypothetical protein